MNSFDRPDHDPHAAKLAAMQRALQVQRGTFKKPGSVTVRDPHVLVDLRTGKPDVLAGEAGPEKITFNGKALADDGSGDWSPVNDPYQGSQNGPLNEWGAVGGLIDNGQTGGAAPYSGGPSALDPNGNIISPTGSPTFDGLGDMVAITNASQSPGQTNAGINDRENAPQAPYQVSTPDPGSSGDTGAIQRAAAGAATGGSIGAAVAGGGTPAATGGSLGGAIAGGGASAGGAPAGVAAPSAKGGINLPDQGGASSNGGYTIRYGELNPLHPGEVQRQIIGPNGQVVGVLDAGQGVSDADALARWVAGLHATPITNQNQGATDAAGAGAPAGTARAAGSPGTAAALGTTNQTDLAGLTSSITNQLSSLQSGISSGGGAPDASAAYLRGAQSILDMLTQQEAQLRSDNTAAGTQIDPKTKFTIDQLRQTLDDNIKSTKEQLNARGLYDSGIELALENKLQKGSASDQAMILADRLSKLQDQLQQGLTSINAQKVSTLGSFSLAGANAQTSADAAARLADATRQQQAVQDMLALRGQFSSSADSQAARDQAAALASQQQAFSSGQSALDRAAQAAQAQAARDQQTAITHAQQTFDAAQAELARNATAANQAAVAQAAAALEQMRINAGAYAKSGPSTTMTPYEQAQISLAQQKFAADQQQNAIGSKATATRDFINQIPQGTSAEAALAALQQNAIQLGNVVDIPTIQTWIMQNLTGRGSINQDTLEGSLRGGG